MQRRDASSEKRDRIQDSATVRELARCLVAESGDGAYVPRRERCASPVAPEQRSLETQVHQLEGAMSNTYVPEYLPSVREIRDTFAEEISSLGGTITDEVSDGQHLFLRAVLAADAEVRPSDDIRSGVALRAMGPEIVVHPYTFRRVCTNGAIAAHALQSRRLERVEGTEVFVPTFEVAMTIESLRAAVRSSAEPDAFTAIAEEMRSASEVEADVAIQLLPAISRLAPELVTQVLPQIFRRFEVDGDRSAFGLMNAITSVARDTRDPSTRWTLETLGGSLPARLRRRPATPPVTTAAVV
jgi:hypothetical protein